MKSVLFALLTALTLLLTGCIGGEEARVFGSRDVTVHVETKDRLGSPATTFIQGESVTFNIIFKNTSTTAKELRWQGPLAIITISDSSGVPVFANGLVELAEIGDGPIDTLTITPGEAHVETITWVGINNIDPNVLFSNDPRVPIGEYTFVITGRAAIDQNPNIPILDSGFLLTSDTPIKIE